MRCLKPTLLSAVALLGGCSSPDYEDRQTSVDIQEQAADASAPSAGMAPPAIAPHAAPGVAFRYGYAFLLADARIADVQEEHAAACERLGPARCRVTGMNYELIDEDRVSARLDLKLAPELARQFGKEGIAAVEKAEGKLIQAAITGDDAGSAITASQSRSANLTSKIARLEQRLEQGGMAAAERAELQRQIAELRRQLGGERDLRGAEEERLASTPMTFAYRGHGDFRFGSNPFAEAGDTALSSLEMMLSVVLIGLGAALPWLVLLALLIAAWRSRPGRWVRSAVRGRRDPAEREVAR